MISRREALTIGNAVGQPAKTAVSDDSYDKTTYSYDRNGNLRQREEYDWVDYISSSPPYGNFTSWPSWSK